MKPLTTKGKPSKTTNPPATMGRGGAPHVNDKTSSAKLNAKQGFKQQGPNQKNGDFSQ